MYLIERIDDNVIIRADDKIVYKAPNSSWIAWRANPNGFAVSQVKDLKDNELITALVHAVKFAV